MKQRLSNGTPSQFFKMKYDYNVSDSNLLMCIRSFFEDFLEILKQKILTKCFFCTTCAVKLHKKYN